MMVDINLRALEQALNDAGENHKDYELNILHGQRDEQWAGWYAAYLLGRLGNFISPTTLTNWLEESPDEGNWSESAALYIIKQLNP